MPPERNIRAIINIEAAISKLLNKYKIVRHVFSGFIKSTKTTASIRLTSSISEVDKITIPYLIIPRHVNEAVITIEMLDSVINNLTQNIRYLVIVNKHGIFALSTAPNIPVARLRTVFKNKVFIEKFYKYNHDYKKLRRLLLNKSIILRKL